MGLVNEEAQIAALEILASELSTRVESLTRKLSEMGVSPHRKTSLLNKGAVGAPLNQTLCNFDFYLNSCENGTGGGSSGDTGFLIVCSALVLMMTIPGLGLYYGGMVKQRHVLAAVMQTASIVVMITFLYMVFGYSLAFGTPNPQDGGHSSLYYGDASRLWFWGLNPASVNSLVPTVPESVYALYQLTFSIITHALICGSFADRINFYPMLVAMLLWHIGVYCPIAHANWHSDGFLFQAGVMDSAGGNVVHISSGCAGLMASIVIGNKQGFIKEKYEPTNILLTFIGASLLWVGWFGFNAGSAGTADAQAGHSALNTQISTSAGAISWMLLEWSIKSKPSVLGMLSGAVAGLIAITPACGWVDQTGAFFIGMLAGPWCYTGAYIKQRFGYDDALDAFGVHATGGILGGILTGFFASPTIYGPYIRSSPPRYPGVFYNIGDADGNQRRQLGIQTYGVVVTMFYSTVVSFILFKLVDVTMGLRKTEEALADISMRGGKVAPEEQLKERKLERDFDEDEADLLAFQQKQRAEQKDKEPNSLEHVLAAGGVSEAV